MITITVDHNEDTLELAVDGIKVREIQTKAYLSELQLFLQDLLDRVMDVDAPYHLEIVEINEDNRKTVAEW